MSKKLLMVAAIIVVLNFNSCSKYEDGPSFTILTKTARLTGEWKIVKVNNQTYSSEESVILEFEKDGDFFTKLQYDNYSDIYEGKWEWADDKTFVQIEMDGNIEEWDITKLTNSEFCFTGYGDKVECKKQ